MPAVWRFAGVMNTHKFDRFGANGSRSEQKQQQLPKALHRDSSQTIPRAEDLHSLR
jgi:hypothetical protein